MADTNKTLVVGDNQMQALEKDCGGDAVVSCPKPTVAIELSQPVACPGHPLAITAVGSPSGGTYAWTITNAELVNASGKPASAGANVYLRSFQPDNASGRIPEVKANVSVKYTHPNGTASASKDVTVHHIDFQTTEVKPVVSALRANEDEFGGVSFVRSGSAPTMNVDHKVTIRLGPTCPRKAECANNHRVGWIQDITEWEKTIRFRHRLVRLRPAVGPPIRDVDMEFDPPFPFYSSDFFEFKDDGDSFRVNHSDSPGFGALWEDSKHRTPSDSPLEQAIFKLGFTAWLVAQNLEVSRRDAHGSFVYLKNFDWSVDCTLNVVNKPPSSRRTHPQFFSPGVGAVGSGKGARTPSFTEEIANKDTTTESSPLPAPGKGGPTSRPAPQR